MKLPAATPEARRRRRILGFTAALVPVVAVMLAFGLHETRSRARIEPLATNGGPHGPARQFRAVGSDRYLALAKEGIASSRRHWWNAEHGWYNDRLKDHDRFPLATIWTLFGLFEALEGVAIAEPTESNQAAVRSFADVAETYYNPSMGGYGPYPGSHTPGDEIWFDDNAWWGLALVDAYRATRNTRYLDDAELALRFIDTQGWDSAHRRMRWSTRVPNKGSNLETFGGAAALAAELYEYTGRGAFLASARTYIDAADAISRPSTRNDWLYGSRDEPPLTYTEGTMIGAHLALCHTGNRHSCVAAWSLGNHAFAHWKQADPFYKPPADTIFFRYVLQLAADKRAALEAARGHVQVQPAALYDWARRAAGDALTKARVGDIFTKFWDGSAAAGHRDGYRSYRYGQLMTHAAPVALFAWLAAVPHL